MTHEELRERLLDLAYGELSPRDARKVEEHAASCETCRAELGRIRATRRLMSALPEEPAPVGGERILVAAAREAARGREPQRRVPRWLWGGSIVAASLAAVVAVSYRLETMRPRSAGRDDPNALMGESRYAQPPPPADGAAPAQERKTEAPSRREPPPVADAPRRLTSRPPAAEQKKSRAPEPPRFAAAPPAPPEPSPAAPPAAAARENAEAERPAAALAGPDAALPPAASAAPPRPAPSRAKAMAAPGARAPESAPRPGATDVAPSDGVARYEALRSAGRLSVEERTFPGCTHELWRRIERDPEGRVVSYAWEEMVGTQRVRLEAVYGPDGKLARKQAFDSATSAPEAVKFRVPAASSVDIDAPPRCGE